ncbi:MAG: DNA recombination protein RmuC [Chlamydiae bacterium CG10_big_fil_rev_8_21_14_0_10_42_34]|nr:MAG: DNA recombination protein RmuC [Chlamydiae bacterium CG10_big_fil_rev_8_21_14_0_10_42_34]
MTFLAILVLFGGFGALWYSMQKKVEMTQKQMQDSFKALSFDVLEQSGKQFLNLADATMQPLRESMKSLGEHQRELEKVRVGAYGALSKQIESLVLSEKELRTETTRLVQALRSPQIRGSWGEVHLKRVVELAGMINHCDFYEQKTFGSEKGALRPDVIVRLPGQRCIAIDAKTPLNAYLDAADAGDETLRKKKLQEHAVALRKHMKDLSSKQYWKEVDTDPEYVVLFLPAEAFFSAALQADPTLIEIGADQNIIIATPTTLIAILRAVAHGWKQESLSKSAREIARVGQELYDRIGIVCDHWNRVGRSLNTAVDSYNQSVASLESRVLVSAKKLKESGSLLKELPELQGVEKKAREVQLVDEI